MKTFILDAVTKSITAVMSGAAATTNPDFTAAYADHAGTSLISGANDGALNGTTPITLVAAPAGSTQRIVKSIAIQNRDTAAVTVTVCYVSAGGTRQIWSGTLSVGDTWTTDGTYDNAGNLKTCIVSGLVTTQHTHAKLVGSTGAVDPALSANAAGALTAAIAPFTFTGGQLAFPAAQNPSADVNTLDDYEEGTWTGAFACGTSGTITIGLAQGAYTKIGNLVTITGLFTVASVSSPIGTLSLTGLPFVVANANAYQCAPACMFNNLEATGSTQMVGYPGINSTTLYFYHFAAGVTTGAAADMKATSSIRLSQTYLTT